MVIHFWGRALPLNPLANYERMEGKDEGQKMKEGN